LRWRMEKYTSIWLSQLAWTGVGTWRALRYEWRRRWAEAAPRCEEPLSVIPKRRRAE